MSNKTKSLPKFAGVYPILYMPFNEKFAIDYEDLRKLTEFVISSGADGLGIAMKSTALAALPHLCPTCTPR